MLRYLGEVARRHRQETHAKRVNIAHGTDRDLSALSRFEAGKSWNALERMVDSYAREVGLEPYELWEEALAEWKRSDSG